MPLPVARCNDLVNESESRGRRRRTGDRSTAIWHRRLPARSGCRGSPGFPRRSGM